MVMPVDTSRALARPLSLLVLFLAILATLLTAPSSLPAASAAKAAKAAPYRSLSNGCSVTRRGIPSCGALAGGAYRANHDPAPWEKAAGRRLGVHRMYFQSGQVKGAVRHAKQDLAKKRLPWISFKVPHSWSAMANGKGDAWARDLARKMKALNGPVWLAFVHEPETDGDIQAWRRMQERLGPIVRKTAPNVGFSVIVMGYHQFFGKDKKYRMANMWPRTKVDIAGFDVYDHYGKNGQKKHTPMGQYARKIGAWAKSEGVAWGLAETGISHAGAQHKPRWFRQTFRQMRLNGGKAMAYFNTNLHSFQDWRLTTDVKKKRFNNLLRTAPRLRG
jgi:hypothetical protein